MARISLQLTDGSHLPGETKFCTFPSFYLHQSNYTVSYCNIYPPTTTPLQEHRLKLNCFQQPLTLRKSPSASCVDFHESKSVRSTQRHRWQLLTVPGTTPNAWHSQPLGFPHQAVRTHRCNHTRRLSSSLSEALQQKEGERKFPRHFSTQISLHSP